MKIRYLLFILLGAFLLVSCGRRERERKQREEAINNLLVQLGEEVKDQPPPEMMEGGDKELAFVQKCSDRQIEKADLDSFIMQKGDLNSYVKLEFSYERQKFWAGVPVVKEFIHNKTTTESGYVRRNPFCAALMSLPEEERLKLCVYMISKGAKTNIADPDSLYPMDYALMYSQNISGPTFENDLAIMDTMIYYGADLKKLNLARYSNNKPLLLAMLQRGGRPQTVDANDLFRFADPEELAPILKYRINYGDLEGLDFIRFTPDVDEMIDLMLKSGFDPNTEIKDGYLIESAITENKFKVVKMLVENGANKTTLDIDPYQFALKNQRVSKEILNYLGKKFK